MKNLRLFAVIIFSLPAISFSAKAQTSIKFIEGIELKNDAVAHTVASPQTETTVTAPEVKKAAPLSTAGKLATEACRVIQFKYSQLMDIEVESISNISLFGFIEEWWNTAYRYGGTTRNGIDCSAFTGLLLSTVYLTTVPRTAREQYSASEKIDRDEIHEGDLVFFNTRGGVSHVGVYLANNYFVHASTSQGVTISNLNDPYYNKRFIGAGRPYQKNSEL
ncbi:MAG: NlpC/P60 family protein [Ferruginibacter sp.]